MNRLKSLNREIMKNRELINKKVNFMMNMRLVDFIGFFDLVNAIASNGNIFITDNDLVLSVKDKIEARVTKFKILTSKEADKELKGKKIELEELDTTVSYVR